jgi:hypothetical protein
MLSKKEQYEFEKMESAIDNSVEYNAGYPLQKIVQHGGDRVKDLYIPFGLVVQKEPMAGGHRISSGVWKQAIANKEIEPINDWTYDQLFQYATKPVARSKRNVSMKKRK